MTVRRAKVVMKCEVCGGERTIEVPVPSKVRYKWLFCYNCRRVTRHKFVRWGGH